jgi:predicted GNAT family acetyltransferase
VPWRLTSDAEEYAERVWDLLAASPAEHTVSLTVLERVRAGHRFSGAPMLFGWLEDGEHVRGAVSMTPPFGMLLGVVPADATDALVAALREQGAFVPGINGDLATAERVAAAWTAGTGIVARVALRLALYELGTLSHPEPPPPGRGRAADARDIAIGVEWLTAFQAEVHTPGRPETEALVRERIDDARLWLWEDAAGAPVALASRTPATAGVARIAPVYTPPEHRRRGYGAAVTAACTAGALERGADHVVLFADLDNPTSNAIYQRIGFRSIGERREVVFDGAS